MKSRDVQQAGAVLAAAGVGSAALLGVTKELLDLAGLGDPEWLDLACTILGGLVVSAGACALLVDELPRGLEPAELAPPVLAFGIVLSLPVTHAWFSSRHVRGSP
jgi:hypothetical protein